jgi:Transposase DNA-binding/Transposase Tn5 dimerisation domain
VGSVTVDIQDWAAENFGSCELGDVRRTRRAVKVAQQMAEHPDGSTPDQMERWSDLKAAYRLFDCEQVTFAALAQPHWQRTRTQARGVVLLIGDTTELNLSPAREIAGLGPTGNGGTQGFLLHNSLMVEAATGEIVGLAGQELFYRQPEPERDNSYQRTQRPRESEVWGRVIDLVGPPADEVQYIHVFDRGADNLEVFGHLLQQRCEWVIRAAQLHRTVWTRDSRRTSLQAALDEQPVLGTYELQVRPAHGQPPRTARLEVRTAQVTLRKPKRATPYLKQIGFEELTQGVVEAREIDPPAGVEPLHWVLWTSLPTDSFAAAWQVLEYYEQRWLVEEVHKAIKTGCRLEQRQYAAAHRLEAVAGLTSVLAVRLVQLKTLARAQPDLPAEQVVPRQWLIMLRALRKRPQIQTIRDFFRHLAGLGGFLMRKRDGEPGWITIWRGLDKLVLALRGHYAMQKRCG